MSEPDARRARLPTTSAIFIETIASAAGAFALRRSRPVGTRALNERTFAVGAVPKPLPSGGAWRVAGSIEIFIGDDAGVHEPAPLGHLAGGDIVFGGGFRAPDGRGYTILAASSQERFLHPIDLERLSAASRNHMIERYLQFGLDAVEAPFVHLGRIVSHAPVDLGSGETIGVEHGFAFVRITSGRALYNGILPVTVGAMIALSSRTWLCSTAGPTRVELVRRHETVTPAARGAAIELVHALIGTLLIERRRAARELRAAGLIETAAYEGQMIERELRDLGGVLTGEDLHLEGVADSVHAAAAIVATASGITLREAATRQNGVARLHAIGDASGVAVRVVALPPDWWRHEIAPFIAFRADDAAPVAIIPAHRGRGFDVVDPNRGTRRPVDAAAAAELPACGYALLRPFPPRPLDARTLLAFATHGSLRDLRSVVALSAFGALFAVVTPLAIALLFDAIVPAADRGGLLTLTLGLCLFALVEATLEFVRGMLVVRVQSRSTGLLQAAIMDRVIALPAAFFRRFGVGDLASRVVGIDQIEQYLSDATISSAIGGVFSFVSLSVIFAYDRPLGFVALTLALAAIGVQVVRAFVTVKYARIAAARAGAIASDVLQMIEGIAKLRVGNAEVRALCRWLTLFAAQRRTIVESTRRANVFTVFTQTWPLVAGLVLLIWVIGARSGTMDAGAFLAISTALAQFMAGVLGLGSAGATAARAMPIYERAQPFLEVVPERREHARDPGPLSGAVAFHDLRFSYLAGGKPTLDAITLDITPGEFVAIVGPSGSGKSTLLRLLLGFEQPQSGSVLYGEQDLRALDAGAVRRQIGTVLQSTRLLPGSIFENIAAGRVLTLDDAWDAARAVGIDAEIAAMPMQMQTFVDSTGGAFSGGQRQRIAIARALATAPRLLYFDEATSALDNATQAVVSTTLASLHVTRIVIAHRLSTIAGADRIVVLESGRIVQTGTYAQLLGQPGLFAQLARRQLI